MPRYHFHAADGSQFRDEDGEELPDLEAAKTVALEVLTEMLPGDPNSIWGKQALHGEREGRDRQDGRSSHHNGGC